MALYSVSAGTSILAADVNQYYNLLTGATTNQSITIGFVGANSERLTSGNAGMVLARGAMSTSSTGLTFTSTSGGTINPGFLLAPGSEDLIFGYDTGGGFTEQFRMKASQSQGLWQTSTVAAVPSAVGYGGGLRLSLYGSPTTDAGAYGFGIAASELWANVPSVAMFRWRANGVELMHLNPAGALTIFNSAAAQKYQFRMDNSSSDPGSPWFRTDGSMLTINPRVANDLFLMYDSSATAGTTHVGQNGNAILKVGEGAGTLLAGPTTLGATSVTTLAASGASSIHALTTSGTVTLNSVGRLVFSGATSFTGGVTATSTYLGITMNGTNYWIALNT